LSERAGIPWDDLWQLRAVARVREIVGRRWGLGLGCADWRSRTVVPPHARQLAPSASQPAPRATICGVLQGCDPGARACQATAHETLQRLCEGAPAAGRPVMITCHAGLRELALPIVVYGERTGEPPGEPPGAGQRDGEVLGVLLCGGFILDDGDGPEDNTGPAGREDGGPVEAALAVVDRRTAPLALDTAVYGLARAAQPRLSPADVELVGELLGLAAEEIAGYARDHGLVAQLAPAGPAGRAGLAGPAGPAGHDARGLRQGYADITGASAPMQELYDLLDRVVQSDATVLIQGENGTGKELVARAIHDHSPRGKRRFLITNCSAFNDNLLDSELFGHARGAFTGAVVEKPGLFEVADQGTFFLDEIGDMSPALQVKVLRVLQEGTFTRVGDTELRKVDVRIIAATNRDLKAMVASGAFREDLFYRIHVISLHIPPLRERPGDIELLVDHFLDKHRRRAGGARRLSRACMARLLSYSWPGNVRELENEIERLVVFAGDDPVIQEEHLSRRIREPEVARVAHVGEAYSLPRAVSELERRMIVASLERNDWNKTRASAELEISRRNLIRLVQKYGLEAGR
jgi:DNA-binding NtrC family response regulator